MDRLSDAARESNDVAKSLYPVAYQAARRSVPSLTHEDWEDVACDSVFVVSERMKTETIKAPKALVCSISANKAKDLLRKIISQKRGAGNVHSLDAEDFHELADDTSGFVANLEMAEAIEIALNSLTEEERSFALDALNHQLSYKELAGKYRLTEGRVGSRLNAIRKKLQPLLKEYLKGA